MTNLWSLVALIQFFFAIVIGLYFWNQLKAQQNNKNKIEKESSKQMHKLQKMKEISLTRPLAEKTRPQKFEEIIGQQEGLKGLRAALCGNNPQHVIIYGPPGTGKTAAARLILEEAKKNRDSPFSKEAKFIELDATTARFDERGIADPLLGSVHDPIYQGAGAMGVAGIPQPKPGAVTKAHGGVLFLDEIGELHPLQMNRLLKVLEDRKVFLESAYYSSEDPKCPSYIHEIFQKGYPADFRLIGATTKSPAKIPPALRSRCVEVFFKELFPENIRKICQNACENVGYRIEEEAGKLVTAYTGNGREVVNIIQIAAGLAREEKRKIIKKEDVEWVLNANQEMTKRISPLQDFSLVGVVSALAVYGSGTGRIMEIEALSSLSQDSNGKINIMGAVEQEEMGDGNRVVKRKSMARSSVDNVLIWMKTCLNVNPDDYDIYLNFPGGVPVDGPSAGVAMAVAIYSSITGDPVDNKTTMTGEVSLRGLVKPVGGIKPKVEAAVAAGAERIIIPEENYQKAFQGYKTVEIISVKNLEDVLDIALISRNKPKVSSS